MHINLQEKLIRISIRYCDSSIIKRYNKIKERRGSKVAIIAAARKLLNAICLMLKEERTFGLDG